MLLPILEACYTQLLAAAGAGPYPPAREALLTACCQCIRGVLTCAGYAGRAGSGMGSAAERVNVECMYAGYCLFGVLFLGFCVADSAQTVNCFC
jgi:hypothetical protein